MDITLFTAAEDLRDVLSQVDPETGLLPEGFESALGLVKRKGAAVGAWIAQVEAECDMVERHARQLQDRVRVARKRADWMRRYLCEGMRASGITEIAIDGGVAKIKRYPERDKSVDIWDERQVPAEYLADPVPPAISKTKIRAALDAGIDVPGARIVAKDRLSIK